MKKREVILSPEALDDLKRLHDWMAMRAGTQTALAYIGRIETHCHGFEFGGERGTRRDDICLGLRTAGFERRVTLAFIVTADRVTFVRVFYGGRDWMSELA